MNEVPVTNAEEKDAEAEALVNNSHKHVIAKSTYSLVSMICAMRTSIDYTAVGLSLSSKNNSTDPMISSTAARVTCAVTECSFFIFMSMFLICRYGINNKKSERTPGANNLMLLYVFVTMLSGAAAAFISSDIEGDTYRTTAGVALVAITNFMCNVLQEKFVKANESTPRPPQPGV